MSSPTNPFRPQALTCCAFHEAGGAMGEGCKDEADLGDLFSSLNSWTPTTPPKPRTTAETALRVETDHATRDAEQADRGAPFRGYHSVCKVCGAPKSRGSVTHGVRPGPMVCPVCEPKVYARAHDLETPSPVAYLSLRADKRIEIDAPTSLELAILCTLVTAGGSAPLADLPRSKRALGVLCARRWCGRSKRTGHIHITLRGREAMAAALKLCLTLPSKGSV